MNSRAGLRGTSTSRPLPELQPPFEFDHLNCALIVLKRRVPHLFGSARSPRRSKRTAHMSLHSRPERSLQGGASPSATDPLDRATARTIVDDVDRLRSVRAPVATQVPGGSSPTQSTPKLADLCSVLVLAERLSVKPAPGIPDSAETWQDVLDRIKEIYSKVIGPLQPNSDSPEDECRSFNTDLMEWIKAQVPVYVSYICRTQPFDEDSKRLIEALGSAHASLQQSAAGDAHQREQVSELITTILRAMQDDMASGADSMSIDISSTNVGLFQIARAERLLEANLGSFMEHWTMDGSLSDEDPAADSAASIPGSDVLPGLLAVPQAPRFESDEESRAQPDDDSLSMESTGAVPVHLGTGEDSRAHSGDGSLAMELSGVASARRETVRHSSSSSRTSSAPAASPLHSANTSPSLDASSPTGDVPPIASTAPGAAREARGHSARSASPHGHNSPPALATEARGTGNSRARPLRTSTPPAARGDARRRVSGQSAGSQDSSGSFGGGIPPILSSDEVRTKFEVATVALQTEKNERSREREAWERERASLVAGWERERANLMEGADRERQGWERERANLKEAADRERQGWERERQGWERERNTLNAQLQLMQQLLTSASQPGQPKSNLP